VFSVFVERVLDERVSTACLLGDRAMNSGFTTRSITATIQRLQGASGALVQQHVALAIDNGQLAPTASTMSVVPFVLGQFSALSVISRWHRTRLQLEGVIDHMLTGLPWSDKKLTWCPVREMGWLVELTEACGRVKGSTSSCHEGLDLTATSVGSTIMHAGTFRPRGISGAFAGSLCMRPSLPVAQAAPYRHTRTGTHRSRQSCSGRGIATPLESMKTSVVVVTGPVAN
jgi:hypothetical protein